MIDEGSFDLKALDALFTYQDPDASKDPEEMKIRYRVLRREARAFAKLIVDLCPASSDRTTAVRTVREALMWANAAIALEEARAPEPEEAG